MLNARGGVCELASAPPANAHEHKNARTFDLAKMSIRSVALRGEQLTCEDDKWVMKYLVS
jgi:hypothetical protein